MRDMFYYDLLSENPVGLWTLDYNTGGLFTDESGQDRDATSTGTNIHVEPVTAGGAASLRISTNTVSFPFLESFREGKESRSGSIEFWVKTDTTAGTFSILRNGKGITFTGSDIVVDLGGSNVCTAQNVIESGIGHHVVVIYTTAAIVIYLDNNLVASSNVDSPDFTGMTAANFTASASGRVANLDTVVFYNYALASNAIFRHYTNATSFIPVQNIAQGIGSIRFDFDDLHLPVARRVTELLGFTENGVIRDNEIHPIYNADADPVFPAVEYLQLIQFDDVETGTATNARVDWEVDGDPSRVTVHSSADGSTWAPVVNHGMTTNLVGPVTNEDFFIRVTIAEGDTDVAVWGLSITLYKGLTYTSTDTAVTATLVGAGTTGYYQSVPAQLRNREGVRLSGGHLEITTHTDFGTVGSVEMLINPTTHASGTYYAKGSARIYRDGSGFHFPGFDRVVINGVSITENDSSVSNTVGTKHIIATFTTPATGVSYVGSNTSGADSPNPLQISYLVMHSRKMTLAEAQTLYRSFFGAAPVRILGETKVTMGEHTFPNGLPVRMYALDWAISESGA